jgi:T4 RnlA family RNA ligase
MEKFEELKEKNFVVNEYQLAGDKLYLVFPKMISVGWTPELLKYRSSIWTADMEPVSLSFKKFFNYGEAPHIVRDFTEKDIREGVNILEKVDGSCLIVSKYKGNLIQRTRGTFSARDHSTGVELDYLAEKYPKAFDNDYVNSEKFTLLYEWTTRANRIVLDYGEDPDIRLVGCVNHETYAYMPQESLDDIVSYLGVERPARAHFKSIDELIHHVKNATHMEGYCVYFNDDQDIKKIKSDWYVAAHRFKSNCTLEYILDMFLAADMPDYQAFVASLGTAFDFECAPEALSFASKICDAYKGATRIIEHMKKFIAGLDRSKDFRTNRKNAAREIFSAYGNTNRASFAFTLLDGKELDKDQIKKLILQQVK